MNYYEVLEISETATDAEIKAAYRKQAKKHHPDTGGDPEKFKQVSDAYECLKDPAERAFYDRNGVDSHDEVLQKLALMLKQCLTADNPIGTIRRVLNDSTIDAHNNIHRLKNSIQHLTVRRDKLLKRNAGKSLIGLFAGVFDSEINTLTIQLNTYEDGIRQMKILTKLLADLEDPDPDHPHTTSNWHSSREAVRLFEELLKQQR